MIKVNNHLVLTHLYTWIDPLVKSYKETNLGLSDSVINSHIAKVKSLPCSVKLFCTS